MRPLAVILVDSRMRNQRELSLLTRLDGETLTARNVCLNGSAALPFSLSHISPPMTLYTLTCTAVTVSSPKRTFTSIPTNLTYLQTPTAP
jgi:hypothetical protein